MFACVDGGFDSRCLYWFLFIYIFGIVQNKMAHV